jgi:hypothetical protein
VMDYNLQNASCLKTGVLKMEYYGGALAYEVGVWAFAYGSHLASPQQGTSKQLLGSKSLIFAYTLMRNLGAEPRNQNPRCLSYIGPADPMRRSSVAN